MPPLDEIIKRNADPANYRLQPLPSKPVRIRKSFLRNILRRRQGCDTGNRKPPEAYGKRPNISATHSATPSLKASGARKRNGQNSFTTKCSATRNNRLL